MGILSGFEYIRKQVELVKKQEKEMRNLREKYEIIKASRDSYDQDELEEIAEEDDDWEEDVMTDIRRLKSNVNKFVTSAGYWSTDTYANDYDEKELKKTVGDYDNWTAFVGRHQSLSKALNIGQLILIRMPMIMIIMRMITMI